MPSNSKNPPKISVYFADEEDVPLYDKIEELRLRKKVSKNRVILEIIRDYFEKEDEEVALISQLNPEYQDVFLNGSDDDIIKFILKELKSIRAEVEEIKKNK